MRLPIACTLEATDRPARVDEWRALIAHAEHQTQIEGGYRVDFAPGSVTVASVSDLAEREMGCCAFFSFTVGEHDGRVTLDVVAPEEALPVVEALIALGATPSD